MRTTGGIAGLVGAFAAGMLSFLSPCVLPLIPGYISFITGMTLSELGGSRRELSAVLVPSLLFVAGFSLVFVGLGASASALGSVLDEYRDVLTRIGGAFVFVMGLFVTGIFKAPWLYRQARLDMSHLKGMGSWTSLPMGMAFAFGWTPCVGPILASILALAGSSADVGRGVTLLLAYSAGLGLPFIAVGLLFGQVGPMLRFVSRHSVAVNRMAGALLMLLGALIFTGNLQVLATLLVRALPWLRIG